jgi:hypothetical protein
MSGSLILYTSAQGQDSSTQRRAGRSSCLKILRSMALVDGAILLTDMDPRRGKWSLVVSESTLTVATRSLVTQMFFQGLTLAPLFHRPLSRAGREIST